MNLTEHYDKLYTHAIQEIRSDRYQLDNLIDSPADDRYGMTLLIRPNDTIKNNIQTLLNDLRVIEPDQYYYPNSDIHVTVMSIISCYIGFQTANIPVAEYIGIINQSIQSQKSITIEFKGVTASPSCVMIQGFLPDHTLHNIRDNLRLNFRSSTLEQTIDKRYTIQTAHSTITRFRKSFTNTQGYIDILEKYRDFAFGTLKTDTLELVYNDWYHRQHSSKALHRFPLNGNP
jgi:2'-5' RNA ligase